MAWAYRHRYDPRADPPNPTARFWWQFARTFPDEFGFWFERGGRVVDPDGFYDGWG